MQATPDPRLRKVTDASFVTVAAGLSFIPFYDSSTNTLRLLQVLVAQECGSVNFGPPLGKQWEIPRCRRREGFGPLGPYFSNECVLPLSRVRSSLIRSFEVLRYLRLFRPGSAISFRTRLILSGTRNATRWILQVPPYVVTQSPCGTFSFISGEPDRRSVFTVILFMCSVLRTTV